MLIYKKLNYFMNLEKIMLFYDFFQNYVMLFCAVLKIILCYFMIFLIILCYFTIFLELCYGILRSFDNYFVTLRSFKNEVRLFYEIQILMSCYFSSFLNYVMVIYNFLKLSYLTNLRKLSCFLRCVNLRIFKN